MSADQLGSTSALRTVIQNLKPSRTSVDYYRDGAALFPPASGTGGTDKVAADVDWVVDDVDAFPGSATLAVGDTLTLANTTIPGDGHNLQAVLNDGGSTSADIHLTVAGTDPDGNAITEIFDLATPDTAVQGTKIFKTVTSVTVSTVTADTESGDTIDVGIGSSVAPGDSFSVANAACPDAYGRNVTVTVNDGGSSDLAGTVEVTGYNQFNDFVSEVLAIADGETTAGSKIFTRIDEVKVLTVTVAAESGDTLDVGFGDRVGLPARVSEAADVKRLVRMLGARGWQKAKLGPGLTADPDFVVDDEDISSWTTAGGDTATITEDTIPDYGRNLTATVSNSGTGAAVFTITVTGEDQFGRPITEDFSFDGEETKVGTKIFGKVTQVQITAETTAPTTNDVLNVGIGELVGLPWLFDDVTDIKGITRAAADGSAAAVELAISSTTVKPTATPHLTAIGSGGSAVLEEVDEFTVEGIGEPVPVELSPGAGNVDLDHHCLYGVGGGTSGAILGVEDLLCEVYCDPKHAGDGQDVSRV